MDWLLRRKTKGINTEKEDLAHGTRVRVNRNKLDDKLEELRQQREIEKLECDDDISDVKFNKMF